MEIKKMERVIHDVTSPSKGRRGGVLRCTTRIIIIASLVLLGTGGSARIARADPHAMFYTAIGQQQLFFNVLAALDQADYVETAQKREQLRLQREQVSAKPQFKKETESGGRFVQQSQIQPDSAYEPGQGSALGTPTLLNRSVTLEGGDLYTDQLVRLFGAESARRNSMSELLRTLCDFGLGFKNCDYSLTNDLPKTAVEREVYRTNTLITDPLAWANWPIKYGILGALRSGNTTRWIPNPDPYKRNPARQSEIQAYLNDYEYRIGKWFHPEIFGTEPYAYSPAIAEMNQYIRSLISSGNTQTGEYLLFLLNNAISSVTNQYMGSPDVIDLPFKHIAANGGFLCVQKDQSGVLSLNRQDGLCAEIPADMDIKSYMAWVANAKDNLYPFVQNIATNAANRIATQQTVIENEGVLADVQLKSSNLGLFTPNSQTLGHPGELSTYIKSPKAARTAAIYGIPNALATMDASQLASALQGLDIPDEQQLVYRPTATPAPTTPIEPGQGAAIPSNSQVAGATSGGQVSGIIGTGFGTTILNLFNPQIYKEYDTPKAPTSPTANLIAPHLEQGAVHALRGLTGGQFRANAGFFVTCGITCP